MTWLHWTLILAGALVAYGVVAYPLCRWLGRNSTTDPDFCRDKAISMAGDADRDRSV